MTYTGVLNPSQIQFFLENHIYATHKLAPPATTAARLKGRRVIVPDEVVVEPYCAFSVTSPYFFSLGAHSYSRSAFKRISIGRFCSIATGVSVMPQNHPMNRLTTSGFDYANYPIYRAYLAERGVSMKTTSVKTTFRPAPVVGNDVWLGGGALLSRGISIGHGAVVGARAIVTRDVPPYAVVAGSPARVIRYRFDEPTVERLLASEWWSHDPAAIADLDTTDPQRFLDQFEDRKAQGGIPAYQPRQIRLAAELARLDPTFKGEIAG